MVVTVICPEEKPLITFSKSKRPYVQVGADGDTGTKAGVKKRKYEEKDVTKPEMTTKEELKQLMKSIKQFNNEQLIGKEKRKSTQDKLTELGVMPLKQQKMPFKMKLAIQQSRERKQSKRDDEQKQSGVVTINTLQQIRERKKKRKGGK